MIGSAARPSKWRIRWAQQENQRRGQAYAAAVDAWQHRDADLRARRQATATFAGLADNGTLPVPLRRGELVYLTVAGVQSVEAPHTTELPPLNWTEPPAVVAGPVPPGIRVRDHGTAVITSRRLLFLGTAHNREWAFDKVTGRLDDPTAPMTLLQVSNRKTASGILLQSAAAAAFRFHLLLATTDAAGQRPGLLAHLDQSIRDHDRLRPAPPMPAEPAQAPARAAWSPLRLVAAGLSVLALLLCMIGVFAPTPDAKPPTRADALVATPVTAASRQPAPPAAVGTPQAAGTPTAAGTPSAAQPHAVRPTTARPGHKPTTKPESSPSPKPVGLCGAPANPLGYTFCGGSLIRSPDPEVCTYFSCIDNFWNGVGYMEQCNDGTVSMSGGRSGSCSRHGGNRRPVYQH